MDDVPIIHRTFQNDPPRFCAACGSALADRDETGGWPCTRCRQYSYLDPKVAACCVPWWEGRLVLVKRAIPPRIGFWASPGGYCDRGEPPASAAAREALEETGLIVQTTGLLGVYSYPGSPVIVIYYDCEILSGGPPRALEECSEVGLFTPAEVPWPELAFPSVHEGVTAAIARRGRNGGAP
jgi:ADP-ribose pyrophosphatase YjhB (NUDIX family)